MEVTTESYISNLEWLIQFYLHETSHLTFNMDCILDSLIKDARSTRKLPDDKRNDYLADLSRSVRLLKSIQNNISFSINKSNSKPHLDLSHVCISETINQTKSLYMRDLHNKCLGFIVLDENNLNGSRTYYETCQSYFEQIFINLINSAIKYSFWGTNIHVNCKAPFPNANNRTITVTDYELFYHGENIEIPNRAGFELYVTKILLESLNGSIKHDCMLVSDYFVPFIEVYIYRELPMEKDKTLLELLDKELSRLKQENLYKEIVFDNFSYKTHKQLLDQIPVQKIVDNICNKTYKTVFEVNI